MFTAPAKDFRETNFTVLPASYGELQLGFRRTLRKGKRVSRPTNSIISWHEARGSLVEVETRLMIAPNLIYFSPEHGMDLMDKAAELGRILNGLIGAIRPAA